MSEPAGIGRPRTLTAHPAEGLAGGARVPGDKSISHRALMIAALAAGESTIEGLLEGEDVLRTAAAMRALGAETERSADGRWHLWGRGLGALAEPEDVLDMGNSGTGARLLLGMLAGVPHTVLVTGDASLRSRPMSRVIAPLSAMGVRFATRGGERLPLAVTGAERTLPLDYRLPVASAQVKSAILLAGLAAPGTTRVSEPVPTRDHTERLLAHFGAVLTREAPEEGAEGQVVSVTGEPELSPCHVRVPADPSSAAFPLVAALLLEGSEVRLDGVLLNPHRTGLIDTLREMGADLEIAKRREDGGEPVGDLMARGSRLHGVEVPVHRVPAMIDEFPILAVAAAAAEGRTVMRGIGELRVKESDRLSAMAEGLAACGVEVEEGEDSLVVHGRGRRPPGGATIASRLDHRIAMSFLVLGLTAERPVGVDDGSPIATSFPDFLPLMSSLGARIGPA